MADGSGENLFLVRDGVAGHAAASTPRSSRASRGPASSTLAGDEGIPVRRARGRPGRALHAPTRSSSPAPPPRSARSTRSTTTRSARPAPITRRLQDRFFAATEGRDPRSAEWLDYVERRRRRPVAGCRVSERIAIYDTTLRDGMQREGLSLSVGEQLAVARAAGRLRRRLPRGRLPGQQPEVRRALPAARARGPGRHPAGRLRHDPPPRRRRRGGPGPARPGRELRPGRHDRRQDLGPPHREGHRASRARRTCG